MKQFRLLTLLALLLTAATGAWAQTETLLTTIESTVNKTFTSGSKTFDDIATVTFSGTVHNDGDEWGWYAAAGESKLLTVAGADGYTITRVKFYSANGSAFDEEAPFEATVASTHAYVNGTDIGQYGVTKIEVYGYEGTAEPAATGYTVSMKDGVKDADKWTVKVGEGQAQALPIGGLKGDGKETVTLQYNGRLKVKGVKATSDEQEAVLKTPATVTTAPTGAAIVGVGKTTALVSGGVADGGTLMYAVTTTNTKPASTDGFSADVPTAQTITASGKVYVWYYVKGDDTHSDSEIAATAIVVLVAQVITWNSSNVSDLRVSGTFESYTKEGVTLSANGENEARWRDKGEENGIFFEAEETGGFTFTAPTGKAFTKIEMKPQDSIGWDIANLGTGWTINNTTITWTGSAASTVGLLTDAGNFNGTPVNSIEFYLVNAE